MATLRQKQLAKAIIENAQSKEPKNAKQLLVSVGYDETTAESQPGVIIEQKGVKEELAKAGFTLEAADTVVADLLVNAEKEETKIKSADLIYKRLGGYAPEKEKPAGNTYNLILNPQFQVAIKNFDDAIKKSLMQQNVQETKETLGAE